MKARKLSTFSLLMAAVAFSAVSVFAANTSSSVKARIESAQKSGKVSREAIVQFRADQDLIDKKEADIRAKHDGLLPARHGVKLTKQRDKLIAKIDKIAGKDPDNTAQNYGDGRKESPTPQVQSFKKEDIDLLQSIRKEIVADNSLSITAKNVKIVVINGTVTLRGVVTSESEKTVVASAAKKFAQDSQVLNELEVKTR
jgi:osmotically-inducible protein OsmY